MMQRAPAIRPYRGVALAMAALYLLVMAYSSTVIGPAGLHFVPLDPADALRTFMRIRFVANGSDQRADWIGNLMMLVPYGFLLSGGLYPRVPAGVIRRGLAYAGALAFGVVTIVTIKYAQLFFPPRTVTLNYIAGQSIGVVIGCAAFTIWRRAAPMTGRWRNGNGLALVLRLYVLALLAFLLMPLDFALNAADLRAQLVRLPEALTLIPGSNRPPPVQALVLLGGTLAFLPVGAWLTLQKDGAWRVRRSLPQVLLRGLALTTGVFVLSTLIMGAYPSVLAILYRTGGIALGAVLMQRIARQDPQRLRYRLGRLVPLLALPYLFALAEANQLLSLHWQSPTEAIEHLYPLGLIPLFDYYIVPKAEAAKNIVAHVIMYMPVGIALWLRRPWARNGTAAAALAGVLSLGIETARYLRPGLEGDINAIAVGASAAWLAATLMPSVWAMLETLVRHSLPAPAQATSVPHGGMQKATTGEPMHLGAEIEHF
jgi:glycopeptide antibiotics resistance protein